MNLKILRKQDHKTQEEIAKFLNTTQQTYARYELETSEPNIDTLCKLADYYNVSLDYLVGRNYANELGYLSKEQHSFVKMYLALKRENQLRALGYVMSLYEEE